MVGSAGATMVCSNALRNMASMMPAMILLTAAGASGAWNGPGRRLATAARPRPGGHRRIGTPGAVATGSGRKGHRLLAFPEPPSGHTGMGMNEDQAPMPRRRRHFNARPLRRWYEESGRMRPACARSVLRCPCREPRGQHVRQESCSYCKASPCWVTSRPSTSACSPTRSGTKNAMPLSSRKVTAPDQASVAAIP